MAREGNERERVHADPEIDWFFENANPNPARVGCPSQEELGRLARKERPIDDPGYEHLAHCSACYQQFRALQTGAAVAPGGRTSSRRMLAIAASLLLMAGATGTYFWFAHGGSASGPTLSGSPNNPVAVLDLRGFLVTRGPASPSREPLKLSRGDSRLELLLPVGFEPGAYEIRLVDGALAGNMLADNAIATFANQTVTLRTAISLRSMQSGRYQLALRRAGEDWHFFPVVLE
jgi:hypothetical protein